MDIDFSAVTDSWRFLATGLGYTLALCILTMIFCALLGLTAALLRCYGPPWLEKIVAFYVDSIRSIPVLVFLVWIFFVVPAISGINLSSFGTAVIALSLYRSAYVAEILRAGIQSIRQGQVRAALALGMSMPQVVRNVVLPQAVTRMLPPLTSMITAVVKDTAITTVIAVPELMRQSTSLVTETFRPAEVFTTTMLLYFMILFPLTMMADFLYRRSAHLGRS
jgi:polar amino acid transport system permease protein